MWKYDIYFRNHFPIPTNPFAAAAAAIDVVAASIADLLISRCYTDDADDIGNQI